MSDGEPGGGGDGPADPARPLPAEGDGAVRTVPCAAGGLKYIQQLVTAFYCLAATRAAGLGGAPALPARVGPAAPHRRLRAGRVPGVPAVRARAPGRGPAGGSGPGRAGTAGCSPPGNNTKHLSLSYHVFQKSTI